MPETAGEHTLQLRALLLRHGGESAGLARLHRTFLLHLVVARGGGKFVTELHGLFHHFVPTHKISVAIQQFVHFIRV